MSLAQEALPAASVHGRRDPIARLRLPVYAACTLLCLCVNYLLGSDLGWDTLNYHYYAGFAALHDRFSQDYFAAGPQSYLNPYAYLPFYALISLGLTALQVSSVLAIVHSIFLWLVYEIAACVCPSAQPRIRIAVVLGAVFLAALDPNLLQEVGTSYSDITTGILVLAGWLALARSVQLPRLTLALLAGALMGAASALKLTNAVHALAATAVLAVVPQPWPSRARLAAIYCAAAGVAFVAVSAPWSYRLWQQFGNPLFPLLNNVFRSPQFPTQAFTVQRFVPSSLAEALWTPFALANPVAMVREEAIRPDVRYAVLMVVGVVVLARWLWQRDRPEPESRVLGALSLGLILDWILWLATSGNIRYALPMAAIAAVVLLALLVRVLAAWPRARNYLLAAILGAQLLQTCIGADYRFDPLPWGGPWARVAVPPRLTAEPHLFLTVGIQSNSFLAPYLGDGSGMMNFSGGYALGLEGANGVRVTALLRRYAHRVRVLVSGARLYAPAERRSPTAGRLDEVLARLALRVDPTDCETIWAHGLPPVNIDIVITGMSTITAERRPLDSTPYVSCRVVEDAAAYETLKAQLPPIDAALDHLEDACPRLFAPRRPLTEHVGPEWKRLYMNTDLSAWVVHGELEFNDSVRGDNAIDLGPAAAWEHATRPLICGRRDGHYHASFTPARSP